MTTPSLPENGELDALGRIAWEIERPHTTTELGILAEMIRVCAEDLRTRLEQAQRERDEARTFQWNAFDEFLDSMRDANGPLAMASAAVTLRDALAALASLPTPKQEK